MKKIIEILKKKKSIPLDKFIELALYDKTYGYYMKKNPLGNKGDFTTSPLISNLFGEVISIWCVAFWEKLGKPKRILLVELGPGDGSLCADLLNSFKNFKEFYNCLKINLLEKSEKLIKIQKGKIKSDKVRWIKKISNKHYGPIIFLGNEFFDSLPIKQVYINKNIFFERHVTLCKNKKTIEFLNIRADKTLIKKIKNFKLNPSNNIIEYPVAAIKYLNIISNSIKKNNGGLLTFDYGYYKNKTFDTLQAVKKHKKTNIFLDPGSADITSLINFKLFLKILEQNNLKVEKITTQSEFLQKLGIVDRANIVSKNLSFKKKADVFYRLRRLIHSDEMGAIFKVMFARNKKNKFSLGF